MLGFKNKKKNLKINPKFHREPVEGGQDRSDVVMFFLVPVKRREAAF